MPAPTISFVFRPGDTARDNVYTDWPKLMTALRSVEGRKLLEFDDSRMPMGCDIPPLASTDPPYDMTDVVWCGFGPIPGKTRTIVNIKDGARFSNLRMIGGQLTIDNQAKTVSPIADFVDGAGSVNHVQIGMRDDCGNAQIFNSGDAPLFDLGAPGSPTSRRRVTFFVQNSLFGIRDNPPLTNPRDPRSTKDPNPLITAHRDVICIINFIGQNQTGNNIVKPPAKALFGALSSSSQIGTNNFAMGQNEFGPVTRIQRKVQPQPPRAPANSLSGVGEISHPNVLLRCDGRTVPWPPSLKDILNWGAKFDVRLPNIKKGFTFGNADPTPMYTGGQEIVVAEVAGGSNLRVKASAGNTIDGSTSAVRIRPHGSRVFASDGESNWITIASHRG